MVLRVSHGVEGAFTQAHRVQGFQLPRLLVVGATSPLAGSGERAAARCPARPRRGACAQVQKSAPHYCDAARDEITLLTQIAAGDSLDEKHCVRLYDHFEHVGPHGKHVCMVFEVRRRVASGCAGAGLDESQPDRQPPLVSVLGQERFKIRYACRPDTAAGLNRHEQVPKAEQRSRSNQRVSVQVTPPSTHARQHMHPASRLSVRAAGAGRQPAGADQGVRLPRDPHPGRAPAGAPDPGRARLHPRRPAHHPHRPEARERDAVRGAAAAPVAAGRARAGRRGLPRGPPGHRLCRQRIRRAGALRSSDAACATCVWWAGNSGVHAKVRASGVRNCRSIY